jgi:hypothetical protein
MPFQTIHAPGADLTVLGENSTVSCSVTLPVSVAIPTMSLPLMNRSLHADPLHLEGTMYFCRFLGLLLLGSILPVEPVHDQSPAARPDYQNPALPTARRVEDLLAG